MEGETSGKMSTSTTTTKIIANTTTTTTTTTTIYNHIFSNTIPNDLACNKLLKSSLFHGVSDVVAEGELVLLYAGYDGIFPGTAEYCNVHPDPERWKKISKDLNIELKPWRLNQKEGHILLCCQRDGGFLLSVAYM